MSTGTTELLGHEDDATQETGVVGGYVAEAGYDYETEFRFGLDVILDRLEQLLSER